MAAAITKHQINSFYAVWHCTFEGMEGQVKLCRLWPGIYLSENYFSMYRFPSEDVDHYRRIKVNFCIEGRCEVRLRNDRYVYLDKKQMTIDTNQEGPMFHFPGGMFKGVELMIDLLKVSASDLAWFGELGIDLEKIYQSLTDAGGSKAGLPPQECSNLFLETDLEINKAECSFYQLRLLFVRLLRSLFCDEEPMTLKNAVYLTQNQRDIAYQVHDALLSGANVHEVIRKMAACHKISPSSLENYFREVYGNSIYRYQKAQRIRKAKELLLQRPDLKIREIAALCGYTHAGKFAESFRNECGMTPRQFRLSTHDGARVSD